jgi:glycerol-1-phosphate dehydrogenase [NAD(P)+]
MKVTWNLPKVQWVSLQAWEESRSAAVVYSRAAWEAAHCSLDLRAAWMAEPQRAELVHWEALFQERPPVEVVYAIGGGLAADAAKYLASQRHLPLVCIPTALSVDAFLTWASGVRQEGCVKYLETKPPDLLLADLDIIAAAPLEIRAAGICDVLSIATGLWDWAFAEHTGRNPPEMAYQTYAAEAARAILDDAIDCAEAAGQGDPSGLKQLFDCLSLEVQLCNQLGHSRPEEGSEHYFAYAVENELGPGLPHGNLVGPGIVQMAALQGQEVAPLEKALRACGISPGSIPTEVVERTLRDLPSYVRKHNLPFGIAHTLGSA